MTENDPKTFLHRYLRKGREAMLWKLDGLGEYDVRRPLTPTGTNLLGLVKHLAMIEIGYFADTFDRPFPNRPAWINEVDTDINVDMWATADESRAEIVDLYQAACAHGDKTIEELSLEDTGRVPWWPTERREVTLHRMLVHMIDETSRHAGHADIVRELVDGAAGLTPTNSNLASNDPTWWHQYKEKVEKAAQAAATKAGE